MKSNQSKVLILPPRPPNPISTVHLVMSGLMLAMISAAILFTLPGLSRGSDNYTEIIALLVSLGASFGGCILGMRAVAHEIKRRNFQQIVERYTKITGDKRYLPYILPVRLKFTAVIMMTILTVIILPYMTVGWFRS